MGAVFRRSYRDKKSGRTKHVRCYSIKYQDKIGCWVTAPTSAVQKHVALRLLHEQELRVQQELTTSPSPSPTDAPARASTPSTSASTHAGVLLEELRDRYLRAIRVRLKPSTVTMYGEVLRFVLPRLGTTTAGDLTLQVIETFMQTRLAEGVAPRTVNIQVSIIHRLLTWAEKQGIIPHNGIAKWQPLREVPKRTRRAMLPEEVRAVLQVAPLHRRVVYAVFLASGVRRSELLQLELNDLKVEQALLIVRPEITKSGKGRQIFLPVGLVELLTEYLAKDVPQRARRQQAYLACVQQRLQQHERQGRGESATAERLRYLENAILGSRGHHRLFVNGRSLPIRRNCNLLREFRRDMAKAGLDPRSVDLHSLRYTCNTILESVPKGGVCV